MAFPEEDAHPVGRELRSERMFALIDASNDFELKCFLHWSNQASGP